MRRIYYNKLIRDKIPEKIRGSGGDWEVRKLSKKEFEKEVLKKIGEEADALTQANSRQKIIQELADVYDVIEEVKRVKNITNGQIRKAQKRNNDVKGGFKKKLFLIWSSDTGYKTNERRYK